MRRLSLRLALLLSVAIGGAAVFNVSPAAAQQLRNGFGVASLVQPLVDAVFRSVRNATSTWTVDSSGNVVAASLSASTVTASTSVQTPDIKGAGGQDRILLPSGDVTTIKGGTNTANFVTVTGAASGSNPTIAVAGSDGSRGLNVAGQGTGGVNLATNQANFVQVLSNTAGGTPSVQAVGSDTNIDLKLGGKGTGGEQFAGKVTKYNGVTTAGLGVSPIYAYGTLAASTTNGATVTSYTPAANGLFEVGGWLNVTAFTSGSVGLFLSYTDCNGTLRAYNIAGLNSGVSAAATTLTATGTLAGYAEAICANATTISLKTTITGTSTSDFYGFIRQVN